MGNIWKRDSPFYQVLNVMPCSRKTFLAVSLSSLFALEEVNKYLQGINSDANYKGINSDANYKAPCYINVPQGTRLPVIDEVSTFKFLSQQKRTAAGPDGLSHWFWRDFAEELAPIATSILNLSIKSQTVPCFWKFANISQFLRNPPPHPPRLSSLNQLRPISVTDIIIRLLEKTIYAADVKPVIRSYVGIARSICI